MYMSISLKRTHSNGKQQEKETLIGLANSLPMLVTVFLPLNAILAWCVHKAFHVGGAVVAAAAIRSTYWNN